ncbi:MAG: hypothetical protein ACI4MF_04255 [Candidatus Faecivicinus sp.]
MLSQNEKLQALTWKCNELDISYGQLMCKSSSREIAQIYDEYEKVLAEREKKRQLAPQNAASTSKERHYVPCFNGK